MRTRLFMSALALLLTSCTGWEVRPLPARPTPIPSNTPRVLTPTPIIYYPTATTTALTPSTPTATSPPSTATLTPEITASPPTPTFTATPTASPIPKAPLEVEILGCDTSVDISHAMGEVTNAYVLIRNQSAERYTGVCATLSASDEEREHPDKQWCLASLPARHQVTLKLTVDTAYNTKTYLEIELTTNEGQDILLTSPTTCENIGIFTARPETLGIPEPIP